MTTKSKTTTRRAPAGVARTQANKSALRDAIAAMNAGSAEKYLALFQPDAQLHGFPEGIDDVESLSEFHMATAHLYPDASVTLDEAIAERDRVATRFTWRASHGLGGELVAQGGAVVRFADGKITECWNHPAELGAVASEPAAL